MSARMQGAVLYKDGRQPVIIFAQRATTAIRRDGVNLVIESWDAEPVIRPDVFPQGLTVGVVDNDTRDAPGDVDILLIVDDDSGCQKINADELPEWVLVRHYHPEDEALVVTNGKLDFTWYF